ncbi:MAG: molybdopterin molybdotransferase MoeA [Flavobacteriaceae bacterium]|nr:molybdopterin molybdotransferase MoeA [Flavobacteriaceae bacterium]
MISVEEAKKLIVETAKSLPPVQLEISKTLNQVLAETVFSPIDYPPFDQSAMDGFVVFHSDILEQKAIDIIGEAPAGNPFKGKISKGQSVQIFTGAKIPEAADTVIIQERVSIEKGKIISDGSPLAKGANIREKGSQIKKGDVALHNGTVLNPGAIGFLAGLGIPSVSVFPKPKVLIIVTGNELQKPGTQLKDGQIYESNSFALKAALESIGIVATRVSNIGDDEGATKESLAFAIADSDVVLVSGGISVGKYDFVGKSLQELQVENIFYKIAQKPGKPIFFGKKNDCLVFGLPGNPASALSCFYEYVCPALQIMQGFTEVFPKKYLPISSDYEKREGLSLFLKGKISGEKVQVLEGQESNNIRSFALADCLIYLPADKGKVEKGEMVEVHLISNR